MILKTIKTIMQINNVRFIFETRGLNTFINYILTHRNIHL